MLYHNLKMHDAHFLLLSKGLKISSKATVINNGKWGTVFEKFRTFHFLGTQREGAATTSVIEQGSGRD